MPFMKPENPQPTETRKPLDKKHTLNHGKDRSTVCVCIYIYIFHRVREFLCPKTKKFGQP